VRLFSNAIIAYQISCEVCTTGKALGKQNKLHSFICKPYKNKWNHSGHRGAQSAALSPILQLHHLRSLIL
jgi:hypothetical protein